MAKQDIFREAMDEARPVIEEAIAELKEMTGGGKKSQQEQVADKVKSIVFGV